MTDIPESAASVEAVAGTVPAEPRATDGDFAARHAELATGYGGSGDPGDPAMVQAMQMVLYLPKAEPPPRSALLAAAAAAAVALCLDPRVGPGGEWADRYLAWKRSRIRKVARRARGAQWAAANEVDGVTVESAGALARALVPGPVGQIDPRIRKLQIGGTDIEHDDPGPPDPELPVLWVNSALDMTLGKAAAQVGHASMLLAGALPESAARVWAEREFACAVRESGPEHWAELSRAVADGTAVAVRDAGFTEVAPGSMTVIATPGLLTH
ncbi:peptidyl-tRNA hydrolase [Nocardia cyriacigeorgica]|uniref:peptidyl-tRNA hydrolase n=1 Tax=Nocardia cyriacigeorgica TaxID=135487 RepID=UPI0002EE3E53|nr:aminoacyl-tRNA hydrolase [Nocardia cyriacigeorgica]MBF6101781.1 peptidyl-tRNA hydrolase [Nocardia cyriacigeorgica]MBF6158867.1 peptidyl-tRNA hydrolase [Nocardia cyriacigeorgica]MBF6197447.1 peptidyl-tRNA hydrolase [Nocardia cyriacigeorgica]MBF6319121.1 peptidyl-tRNA hydrolase [Nocardia cyriacigeorgica]MBF6513729.1 peptidyl-tRNA hydrolase [Nocardia cyriacigeorgica]